MGNLGGEVARPTRRTVLIVEEDAFLRTMYGFLLEQDGFSVLSAPDGPQAMDLVARHGAGIDLIVTEYMMAGTSGLEAWRELRSARQNAEPEVLFLAGEPHKVQEALRAEGLDRPVLAKPFHPDAFLNVVRALVGPRAAVPPE